MQPENLALVPAGVLPEDLILRNFAAAIGRRRYEHWFHQKTRFKVQGDELVISVTNPFLVNWLPQHFRAALISAAQPVLGLSANVRFDVNADAADISGPASLKSVLNHAPAVPAPDSLPRLGDATQARPETVEIPVPAVLRIKKEEPRATELTAAAPARATQLTSAMVKPVSEPAGRPTRRYADLLEFVSGTSNEFALAAAKQVSDAPGTQFTTLFIHGPVGVGKTHLLEGICKQVKQRFPARQVVYLTAEAFANFFTQALREHKLPSFRQRFRSVDVLIVDDIDFLMGKSGIQEEFLFTIQHLEAHGRQIVVGAHGHPRLLTKLSDELRTRFLSGMVCRIDAPDAELRRRFVEFKSVRKNADFSPEVTEFIADRFRNNLRELEGAFNTLCAYQQMQAKRLGVTAARHVLADLERDCIRVVRLADVEQAVCDFFGVTNNDLKSSKRLKSLTQPRMLAMFLARKHTRSAYAEIGDYFGGRNHSTVMAAEKKVQASLQVGEPIIIRTQTWRVNDLIEVLEQQLQAG